MRDEPPDRALHVGIVCAEGRHQAHRTPGGLRRGALADALESGVVIAGAGFAEAAVELLHALEPGGGALHVRGGHVFADDAESGEDLPGSVDVVDAPSAPPGAGLVLL